MNSFQSFASAVVIQTLPNFKIPIDQKSDKFCSFHYFGQYLRSKIADFRLISPGWDTFEIVLFLTPLSWVDIDITKRYFNVIFIYEFLCRLFIHHLCS